MFPETADTGYHGGMETSPHHRWSQMLTSVSAKCVLCVGLAFATAAAGQTPPAPDSTSPTPVRDGPAPQSSAQTTPPIKFGIEKHGAIVYHTGETYLLKCDVYQPTDSAEPDQSSAKPTIVMIHGGGWRTGTKFSMIRHARRLARVGYVVVAINYRLAPKYPWPDQIEDCRAALQWIRTHAQKYDIDTQRIGVFGYSAGGHLAAMLATTNERNGGVKIRAAAVGGTPAEFSWIGGDSTALVYWLGATKNQNANLYQNASPNHHVTPDDPPFFIFHAIDDWIVPVQSSRLLDLKLKENNVASRLIEVPDSGHLSAFSNMDLMPGMIRFFDQHLKPPQAPQ